MQQPSLIAPAPLRRPLWTPRGRSAPRVEHARCMPPGLGFSLGVGGRSARRLTSSFDPATLALTGWWRADYESSPWTGTASAGDSGGRTLAQAITAPTQGTSVNGKIPAAFNGTTQSLTEPTLGADSYLSAASYDIIVLAKATAGGAAATADAYGDQQVMCWTSDLGGIAFSNDEGADGVRAWHYDGVGWKKTATVTMATGAYHMIRSSFSGGTLSTSLDCGTAVTVAAGNASSLAAAALRMSRNGSTAYMGSEILEMMTFNTTQSNATAENIKSYFNARYSLTL